MTDNDLVIDSTTGHASTKGAADWTRPATYDFTTEPALVTSLDVAELQSQVKSNFLRSARWCLDGSSILTSAEDRTIRIFPTPSSSRHLLGNDCSAFKQPDAVLGALWYPTASLSSPATYCFVASVRDCPVRLIDASSGRTRASYPIVDHRERFVGPQSMAFNSDATKLYCGFESAIEVFDIATPGYDASERIKTASAKREAKGQRGIVSALSFAHDGSGVYAAGTYGGTVSIYEEESATAVQHLEGVLGGGVTQLAFHPLSKDMLFVASRRSDHIQIFDVRNPTQPLLRLPRPGDTNQRLEFAVDPWGRYISSGDAKGTIRVWDISQGGGDTPVVEAKLHSDAISSVQLHPLQPLLMTNSGSRRLLQDRYDGSDSDTSESEENSEGADSPSVTSSQDPDARLAIWRF